MSGPTKSTSNETKIASEEVVPGKLRVAVLASTLSASEGPVPCWTYVTDGLWPLGQKEIAFTVRRRPSEPLGAYPRDLLRLCGLIYPMAEQKRFVDVGDSTVLSPGAALLGRGDFNCVLYAPPQTISGVRISSPWLTALILTSAEMTVAQEFGVVRLMATLGNRHRYFPTAPWTDPDRPPLASPRDMESSFLSSLPRARVPSVSVRREGRLASRTERPGRAGLVDTTTSFAESRIALRLRPRSAETLATVMARLPSDSPIALLVDPDPSATSCMVWEPGQKDAHGISSPGASGAVVAGNFIVFAPGQDIDKGIAIEDGFGMFLRNETWQSIRATFLNREPLSVPATGMGLEIVWAPELDPDFVDPHESQIDGGWDAFFGVDAESSVGGGPVQKGGIVLLTNDAVLQGRVESTSLANYMKAIDAKVEAHLARAKTALDLAIECEVLPDGLRTIRIEARPHPPGGPTSGLRELLMQVPPPPVAFGPVRFQLNFELLGGTRGAGPDAS